MCALGEFSIQPVLSTIQTFRTDYLKRIERRETMVEGRES